MVLYPAVSLVSSHPQGSHDHAARMKAPPPERSDQAGTLRLGSDLRPRIIQLAAGKDMAASQRPEIQCSDRR